MTRSGVAGDGPDESSDSEASFAHVLEGFKRDGCLLLVTGDVSQPVAARASRKLLGTPTEYRHRVLAVTDPRIEDPGTHLPGTLTPDSDGVSLVDKRAVDRSAPEVDALVDAILDALPGTGSTEGTPPGPASSDENPQPTGRVRFALATLAPYRETDTFRTSIPGLLDALHDAAHEIGAIGAVHLPVPDDHPDVETLTPHVDARIEVRDTNTALPEQRWYLPADDTSTNWVTM